MFSKHTLIAYLAVAIMFSQAVVQGSPLNHEGSSCEDDYPLSVDKQPNADSGCTVVEGTIINPRASSFPSSGSCHDAGVTPVDPHGALSQIGFAGHTIDVHPANGTPSEDIFENKPRKPRHKRSLASPSPKPSHEGGDLHHKAAVGIAINELRHDAPEQDKVQDNSHVGIEHISPLTKMTTADTSAFDFFKNKGHYAGKRWRSIARLSIRSGSHHSNPSLLGPMQPWPHPSNGHWKYFSAPQQLTSEGELRGHKPVVVEPITGPGDPYTFTFYGKSGKHRRSAERLSTRSDSHHDNPQFTIVRKPGPDWHNGGEHFSAPQQVGAHGEVRGHRHIVVEPMTGPATTDMFSFFKGKSGKHRRSSERLVIRGPGKSGGSHHEAYSRGYGY